MSRREVTEYDFRVVTGPRFPPGFTGFDRCARLGLRSRSEGTRRPGTSVRDDDATRKRYEAVAVAFRQHGRTIFEYVLRRIRDPSLAEDITEDVFVAALKGLP